MSVLLVSGKSLYPLRQGISPSGPGVGQLPVALAIRRVQLGRAAARQAQGPKSLSVSASARTASGFSAHDVHRGSRAARRARSTISSSKRMSGSASCVAVELLQLPQPVTDRLRMYVQPSRHLTRPPAVPQPGQQRLRQPVLLRGPQVGQWRQAYLRQRVDQLLVLEHDQRRHVVRAVQQAARQHAAPGQLQRLGRPRSDAAAAVRGTGGPMAPR